MCVRASYLVAIHHEVVGSDKGFEDHHPAGVGCALKQRVCQLRNVDVHLIGAVDQIWQREKNKNKRTMKKHEELLSSRKQTAVMRKVFEALIILMENNCKLLFTEIPKAHLQHTHTHIHTSSELLSNSEGQLPGAELFLTFHSASRSFSVLETCEQKFMCHSSTEPAGWLNLWSEGCHSHINS